MNETFADLFQQSLKQTKMRAGDIVIGTVVGIDDKYVLVDVGLKSEGTIPKEQFMTRDGEMEIKVGDETEVVVEMPADDGGETRLSREKAKRAKSWVQLVKKYETKETVKGLVSGKVKGGFTVEIDGVRAFLPGSLVDIRTVSNTANLEGNEFDFKIIKVDEKRNNIVVSRRAVIEEETSAERSKLLENLEEGQVIKGIVKNLTDYGAFIDLGGIDGLLHITDMAWKRVKLPSEVLKIGQEIEVVVLKFDRERSRVSLGMKQLHKDPWLDIKERYPEGTKLTGKVTNLTDYGCFVEIEDGVEGLVHMSEMDWTNKNIHPSKIVSVGDEVEVIVLEINEDRRRISLGMKQCVTNPWIDFAEKHAKDERIAGKIKSITDFGIFIGLEGNIDGLVHLSDISWDEPGEQAIRKYKKGDEIEVVILAIDPERERISLGVKQLQDDPFNNYANANPKGSVVKGKITQVEEKQAVLELAPEVIGRLKVTEISTQKISDAREVLKEEEEIEVKVISINRKNRYINVSIRALTDTADDNKAKAQDQVVNTTIGDLLKEKMQDSSEKSED
jgi:small subunit ribosomal protein S1